CRGLGSPSLHNIKTHTMAVASEYVVLARKWRPQTFQDLVGQEHVVRALGHALDAGRLHHAYLFTGSRGVGKTTISRLFAKAVNCEVGLTRNPCNVCSNCIAINEGHFVDYIEMDAASNRGVDEMSQLIEKAVYAPAIGQVETMLGTLDQSYMMTLLKALFYKDGVQVYQLAKEIESRGLSMQGAMGNLALLLHQIAWYQQSPTSLDDGLIDVAQLDELSKFFLPEQLQLYYQIATYAQREIALAPDEFTGFTMALLRMLAFAPLTDVTTAEPTQPSQSPTTTSAGIRRESEKLRRPDKSQARSMPLVLPVAQAQNRVVVPEVLPTKETERVHLANGVSSSLSANISHNAVKTTEKVQISQKIGITEDGATASVPPLGPDPMETFGLEGTQSVATFNGDWQGLTERLVLTGMSKQLALQSELVTYDRDSITLKSALSNTMPTVSQKLELALSQYFKRPIKVKLQTGAVKNTPALVKAQEKAQAIEKATHSLSEHPIVKTLINELPASVVPNSVEVIR
ncbi:unnamed protein product, partial [Darwinula stevensoni]